MMSLVKNSLLYIHQKHEKPNTLVKKGMREFDRRTRGWFLRKVVPGHGGGGEEILSFLDRQNIKKKKTESFPFLSSRGWKTASAVCAHTKCH